jgi:hypothetical protein
MPDDMSPAICITKDMWWTILDRVQEHASTDDVGKLRAILEHFQEGEDILTGLCNENTTIQSPGSGTEMIATHFGIAPTVYDNGEEPLSEEDFTYYSDLATRNRDRMHNAGISFVTDGE